MVLLTIVSCTVNTPGRPLLLGLKGSIWTGAAYKVRACDRFSAATHVSAAPEKASDRSHSGQTRNSKQGWDLGCISREPGRFSRVQSPYISWTWSPAHLRFDDCTL
jgi:hypothetical protein